MNFGKFTLIHQDIHLVDNNRSRIEVGDTSTKLLGELEIDHIASIFEIFSPSGVFGIETAKKDQNIAVIEYSTNINDLEVITQNTINNQVGNLLSLPVTDLFKSDKNVDLVIIRTILEKRKQLIIDSAITAARLIKTGGNLVLVGAKKEGIRSIASHLSRIFSIDFETICFKKGVHLINFHFPNGYKFEFDLKMTPKNTIEVQLDDISAKLVSDENTFAKGKLDHATQLLINNLAIHDGDKVLDLGCGSGIIGIIAAKLAKNIEVIMVDNDYLTVETSKRNLILNKLNNCRVLISDGTTAVKDQIFDCVVTNPPFHQGKKTNLKTAEKFVQQGFDVLSPEGKFYLVCNIFLPLENKISQIFGNYKILSCDKSFKVISATKSYAITPPPSTTPASL